MKPETWLDAYTLFQSSPAYLQNPKVDNNLRTALRIVLEVLGFESRQLQREQLDTCLGQVLLSQLDQVEALFEASVEALRQGGRKLSDGSIRNYRSALARFIAWLREQRWYYTLSPRDYEDRAPELSVRKSKARRAEDKRQKEETLPFLNWDALEDVLIKPNQLNAEILAQLEEYEKFWTTTEIGLRKGPPMQLGTIQRSLTAIYFLFGWLNQQGGVDAEALTLEVITEPSVVRASIDWAVSNRQKSYCWASDVVKVALLVAKFCHPHAKNYDSRDIPTVKALRSYLGQIRELREDVGYYSLPFDQLTGDLKRDWDLFEHFCQAPEVPERKSSAIGDETFRNYKEGVLGILGWQHNIQGTPIEQLSLASVADIDVLKGCVAYLINVRKTGYGRAVNFAYAAMAVAKWLNPHSKRQKFSDIEQVADIRDYVGYLRRQNKDEEPRQDLSTKRLSFYEAQLVIEYLRRACAPLDKYGGKRSEKAVMSFWQDYLIVSILTYCPVRQKEIREMTLDGTLFREADGYWVKLNRKQHKAGQKSRKGREYPLPKHLSEDLDYWLETLRPTIPTSHDLVFVRMGANRNPATRGGPLDKGDMSDLVSEAVERATAVMLKEPRNTTPHVFRRIGVTFQRKYGRPEQREAFAELMGHTVKEADATYNEETLREKAQAAEDWWKLTPEKNSSKAQPELVQPNGWVADDKLELVHLGVSDYQNDYLRKARDRALLVLWALQELAWAEMHRLDIGHFKQDGDTYCLEVTKADGEIARMVSLKPKIGKIFQGYIKVRTECGEEITPDSPLFVGTGNRSGNGRLYPTSFQRIIMHYLGVA